MKSETIGQVFLEVCDLYGGDSDRFAFSSRLSGNWTKTTHSELRENVECLAIGLQKLGLKKGDRVGILSENRLEWIVTDLACALAGLVDVPIFPTNTAKQAAYVYGNCNASAVVVSNRNQLKKIRAVRTELPDLKHVIVFNQDAADGDDVVTLSSVIESGRTDFAQAERESVIRQMSREVSADDLLTLVYTSGTTGPPKGVMLTHRNVLSNIQGTLAVIEVSDRDIILSYLPLCHSYERMAGYYLAFSRGVKIFFAESIETVARDLVEVKPTFITSVPRLFERIRNAVLANVGKQSSTKQKIFHDSIRLGCECLDHIETNTHPPSLVMRIRRLVADKLVFRKIRDRTGGRLRFFVSGGAPLSYEVGRFFQAIGLTIIEGYGLTEASPVVSFNRLDDIELGSVGKPLPNIDVRIAIDGEILVRGPNVMKGYWHDDAATKEAIQDGWLHTGDIGDYSPRGNLRITDRKKNILVSSGGKNIAPSPIESLLSSSKYIDQIVLLGDRREYCTALVVPDMTSVNEWLMRQGSADIQGDLNSDGRIRDLIWAEIQERQKHLSKVEQVRRFSLLEEPFTVENGMLTPTLKIKRKDVESVYADSISKMYEDMK